MYQSKKVESKRSFFFNFFFSTRGTSLISRNCHEGNQGLVLLLTFIGGWAYVSFMYVGLPFSMLLMLKIELKEKKNRKVMFEEQVSLRMRIYFFFFPPDWWLIRSLKNKHHWLLYKYWFFIDLYQVKSLYWACFQNVSHLITSSKTLILFFFIIFFGMNENIL